MNLNFFINSYTLLLLIPFSAQFDLWSFLCSQAYTPLMTAYNESGSPFSYMVTISLKVVSYSFWSGKNFVKIYFSKTVLFFSWSCGSANPVCYPSSLSVQTITVNILKGWPVSKQYNGIYIRLKDDESVGVVGLYFTCFKR